MMKTRRILKVLFFIQLIFCSISFAQNKVYEIWTSSLYGPGVTANICPSDDGFGNIDLSINYNEVRKCDSIGNVIWKKWLRDSVRSDTISNVNDSIYSYSIHYASIYPVNNNGYVLSGVRDSMLDVFDSTGTLIYNSLNEVTIITRINTLGDIAWSKIMDDNVIFFFDQPIIYYNNTSGCFMINRNNIVTILDSSGDFLSAHQTIASRNFFLNDAGGYTIKISDSNRVSVYQYDVNSNFIGGSNYSTNGLKGNLMFFNHHIVFYTDSALFYCDSSGNCSWGYKLNTRLFGIINWKNSYIQILTRQDTSINNSTNLIDSQNWYTITIDTNGIVIKQCLSLTTDHTFDFIHGDYSDDNLSGNIINNKFHLFSTNLDGSVHIGPPPIANRVVQADSLGCGCAYSSNIFVLNLSPMISSLITQPITSPFTDTLLYYITRNYSVINDSIWSGQGLTCSGYVGLQILEKSNFSLALFPNPTTSTFTLTTNITLTNPQIKIYNTLGENIYSEEIKTSGANFSKQISLNAPSGIYFVKVGDGEKEWTGKLVVR